MTPVLLGLAILVIVVMLKTVKIVPQKQAMIVERLGKYHRTAEAGLNTIVPFIDAVRAQIDLREQITKIEPQSVITRDNVTMEVDAVIYSVVVDPVRSTYEVQNLKWGIEQLTLSALRNVIGALDLDHTLTSRDNINTQLALGARHRDAAMGRQGDAHRAQEHRAARRDPADDGKADDGGADAPRRRHDRRGREIVGDPARRRPEAVADRQRRRQQAGGDSRRRGSGRSAAARRAGRGAGDRDDREVARRHRQPGAVSHRQELSRVARPDRDQRPETGVPALRSERRDGVARRHPRAAAGVAPSTAPEEGKRRR